MRDDVRCDEFLARGVLQSIWRDKLFGSESMSDLIKAGMVWLVLAATCGCLWGAPAVSSVATVPWALVGQGPDRRCESPYAGPLSEPTELFQVPFASEAIRHIGLDREGSLLAASLDGYLFKLVGDPEAEEVVTATPVPRDCQDLALAYDGTAYVTSKEGKLVAVLDSMVKWEVQIAAQGPLYVVPTPAGVVVVSADGKLLGFDEEGRFLWEHTVSGQFECCSRPAVGPSGTIYFSVNGASVGGGLLSSGSILFAFSGEGEEVWGAPVSADSLSCPVVDEEERSVYVAGSDGNLYSFSPDGDLKWAVPVSEPGRDIFVACRRGSVFVLSGGQMRAVSEGGEVVWSTHIGEKILSRPALGSDGMLYALTRPIFQGSYPVLVAVGDDGEIRWTAPIHYQATTGPIITIKGDICIGTSEGSVVYLVPGRGDITAPYLAETFPPKGTVVPIDDFKLTMVMKDRGVGIVPSSIWVAVNSSEVEISKEEVPGGFRVQASPHEVLSPFQDVLVEIWAEDKLMNQGGEPFHLTAVEFRKRPKIVMAGFGFSNITSARGGELTVYARLDPISKVSSVRVYDPQGEFELQLADDGKNADDVKGDLWYSGAVRLPRGIPQGRYLLEMVAEDIYGRQSLRWPYLTVLPGEEPSVCLRGSEGKAPAVDRKSESNKSGRNGGSRPYIVAAGYTYSYLTVHGGVVKLEAWVLDDDGDIDRVEVFVNGVPTGLCLSDYGRYGDSTPNDGIYTYQAFFRDEILASGEHLFELKAFDKAGNESDLWPYVQVR